MLLLLLPVALALVVVSVLGLVGIGPLTDERRATRDGFVGAFGPMVGLLSGFLLLAVAVLGSFLLIGIGGGEDDAEAPRSDRARRSTTRTTPRSTPREPRRRTAVGAVPVTIDADDGATFPSADDAVDRLAPDTVLTMRVRGFEPFARAIAEQCAGARCANVIPVQFDERGVAQFQYLVAPELLGPTRVHRGCRATGPVCTIVVRTTGRGTVAEIRTVFVDALPPVGRVTADPVRGIALAGEDVTVTLSGFPAGARLRVGVCAAPDVRGPRCGAPGPEVPVVIDPDGRGRARLPVAPGDVGRRRARCGRGDDCGISVVAADRPVRAPVVPITFAAPPGASYDPTRLALGLALAAALVAVATWLVLRTDWSAVGEAAAPEIDDAVYADLDAIIAALPPEEDEVGVTAR